MAGILNSKQRIMDVLVTENGRRQIADGTFKISFASFSDHGVFYRDDGSGAADDAGSRLMFEAYSSNTDVIIPEINSANAISMDTSSGKNIVNGFIVEEDDRIGKQATFLSGAINVFSSSADVIKTAIDNFDRLQVIGTKNVSAVTEYFKLSKTSIRFNDLPDEYVTTPFISDVPAIWANSTTNSQPQFKYMPPTVTVDSRKTAMGTYARLNTVEKKSFDALKNELKAGNTQEDEVTISTSDNVTNLLLQCFEIKENEINKLCIIHYGDYYDDTGAFIGSIYHLGKLYRDNTNVPKFIRILSLLFE